MPRSAPRLVLAAAAAFAAAVLPPVAGPALAQEEQLGTSSFGTSVITARKRELVRITGVDDITFPLSTTVPSALTDQVCVFSNTQGKSYTVTATSASGSAFELTNAVDPSSTIGYDVGWADDASGSSFSTLNAGNASSTFTTTNANGASPNCNSPTAVFRVSLNTTDFDNALGGVDYTDTLTLTIAPQ